MTATGIIVCEKTGRWAAALRRALPRGCDVIETRSFAQCEAELDRRATLAAVEVTPVQLATAVPWLRRASQRPHVRLAALVTAELAAAEPLLREAGAVDVLVSLLDVPRLLGAALRHRVPAPDSRRPLRELILQRLPWPSKATFH